LLGGLLSSWPLKSSSGQVAGGRSYTVSTYGDAKRNPLIDYWVVHGMGHAWSGGSASQQYADASGPNETAAMYSFFSSHPMT
jgi:poly(3-hydroxybutyrate) depolymerase